MSRIQANLLLLLAGAWFLGERLPAAGILGCGLIFAAIVAVEILPPLLARRHTSTL